MKHSALGHSRLSSLAPALLLLTASASAQHPALDLELLSVLPTEHSANFVQLRGTRAYVVSSSASGGALEIFDVSDPAHPVRRGLLNIFRLPTDVHVAGQRAYLCDVAASSSLPSAFYEIDVSDPTAPQVLVCESVSGNARASWADGTRAVLAAMDGGVQTYSLPGLWLEGLTPTPEAAIDVEVQGGYAFVCDYHLGNDYLGALVAVDVSDPTAPHIVSSARTFGTNPLSVALQGNSFAMMDPRPHAYVADGTGLQVFDISQPTAIARDGRVDLPGHATSVTWQSRVYSGYGRRDLCFVALGYAGLGIVDATDSAAPAIAALESAPGYVQGIAADQSHVYVADNDRGLAIYRYLQLPE